MLSLSRRAYSPYGGCLMVALSVILGPSASGRCAASFDALAASSLLSFSSTTTAIHLCHQYTSLRPRRQLPRGLFCIDDRATVTDDRDSHLLVHTFTSQPQATRLSSTTRIINYPTPRHQDLLRTATAHLTLFTPLTAVNSRSQRAPPHDKETKLPESQTHRDNLAHHVRQARPISRHNHG